MPLSKARNRERMRLSRLHNHFANKPVQPKTVRIDGKDYILPELDADGNVIYEEG